MYFHKTDFTGTFYAQPLKNYSLFFLSYRFTIDTYITAWGKVINKLKMKRPNQFEINSKGTIFIIKLFTKQSGIAIKDTKRNVIFNSLSIDIN